MRGVGVGIGGFEGVIWADIEGILGGIGIRVLIGGSVKPISCDRGFAKDVIHL